MECEENCRGRGKLSKVLACSLPPVSVRSGIYEYIWMGCWASVKRAGMGNIIRDFNYKYHGDGASRQNQWDIFWLSWKGL